MEVSEKKYSQPALCEMAALMLPRLSLCVGVTSGFCLILVLAWQQNFTTWQMISWCLYAIGIFAASWYKIRRLSVDVDAIGMTSVHAHDINKLTFIIAVATGLIWTLASAIQLYQQTSDQWLYLYILIGAAASSGMLFSYNIKAALINVALILLPCSLQIYLMDHSSSAYFIVFTLVYLATLYVVLIQFHQILDKNLALRIESQQAATKQAEISYLFEQHWTNTPLAAIQWDRTNRVIDWNPSAEQLFGYSRAEAMHKHADFFVATRSREASRKMWSSLFRQQQRGRHSVHEIQHKDGKILTCEWHNTALQKDGELIGAASFVEDITSQIRSRETIQQQATMDSLTGLPNRRLMMTELAQAISRCHRTRQYSALLFLDLDHFKDINDTRGHDVGDIVLKLFASSIRKAVRKQDMVARFGGDEFVVLVEDLGGNKNRARDKVYALADKIMELGKEASRREGLEYEIEVSGGMVLFNNNKYSPNDILKQADLAMYRVKKEGRKGFCFYDDSLAIEAEYRVTMIHELRKGMENQEFDMHFQPIVDSGGKMISAESLLCWRRPSRGVVPASEFIDFIASLPMMCELGFWLFEKVCMNIVRWRDRGVWSGDMSLFINISPKQFHDDYFAIKLKNIIEKHDINPRQIVLEITEESLIHNLDKVQSQLKTLIGCGIRIALDDFGTGYSSLAMLQDLPVQYVKLDREFIKNLDQCDDTHSIVRAVVKLCEILSLEVIAEGVETEEQYQTLRDIGCTYFQGYYFNKPMPSTEMTKLMDTASGESKLRLVASTE